MFKPEEWEDTEPVTIVKPKEGYYILNIVNAIESSSKANQEPLLKFEFDIAEGDFSGYYSNLSAKINKNVLLQFYQLTNKKESLPYFKRLVLDLEKSNYGYKFDFNAHSLRGKKIGAFLINYEYETRFGRKTTLRVNKLYDVGYVREQLGNEIVSNMQSSAPASQPSSNFDDLPFS